LGTIRLNHLRSRTARDRSLDPLDTLLPDQNTQLLKVERHG